MKYKFFLLLSSILLFAFGPKIARAINQTETERLTQQIEILKQQANLLQTLFSNLQSQQEITAQSYLAVRISDNAVVLNKNPDQPYSIASVTKLMTAAIAFENIKTSQTIKMTEEMLKPLGTSPALYLGSEISAENLIKASLIQSSNDAAEALSYFLGKEKFLNLMNQKAKQLEMINTVFYDVSGLNPGNRSSAADLAKLLTYIYVNHKEILTISKSNDLWLPDKNNKMVKFKNVDYLYPLSAFIGGKTGYLTEAKQTLASIFNVNGKTVSIIVLYSKNYQADALAIIKKLNSLKSF
jgi:D-alanyl-D-alanine carboxypeptidase